MFMDNFESSIFDDQYAHRKRNEKTSRKSFLTLIWMPRKVQTIFSKENQKSPFKHFRFGRSKYLVIGLKNIGQIKKKKRFFLLF
jgi:hypothetical protein